MIVADRKSLDDIKEEIKDCRKVLILGCGTCTSVCMAGGEKEVEILASQLRMTHILEGKDIEIGERTIQRQCDREYIDPIVDLVNAEGYDAVLSMACGAGVQFVAEMMEHVTLLPALDTRFLGVTEAEGVWAERCRSCGECLLADTGGICPVTMCSKGLINGPCGGSKGGKCEAGPEKDCAWEMIYYRLKKQGKIDNLRRIVLARDNRRRARPMRQVNGAYQEVEEAVGEKA